MSASAMKQTRVDGQASPTSVENDPERSCLVDPSVRACTLGLDT